MSTGEIVHKWTRYFHLFFPTRPSDEFDSAPSRKYSRPLFGRFRLYRLSVWKCKALQLFGFFFFHSEFENMSLQNLNCYFRPVDFIAFSQPKIPENPTASELIVWVINNYLKIVIISKFHMICILQSLIMVTHAQILTPFLP